MNSLSPTESKFVLDELNLYIAVIAEDHTLSYANKQLLNFSAVHFEHIHQLPYWELPWWQNGMNNQNRLMFAVERAFYGETVRFDATYMKYDGSLHEIDFILKPLYKRDEVVRVIAMGYNISDLVKTQKALTRRQRQLDAFFNFSSDGYFFYLLDQPFSLPELDEEFLDKLFEHQKLIFFNQRLEKILNRSLQHTSKIAQILPIPRLTLQRLWRDMILNGSATHDFELLLLDDDSSAEDGQAHQNVSYDIDEVYDRKYLRIMFVAIFDEEQNFEGNFAVLRDRTQDILNIKRLEFLANKDPLTKIDNRRSFYSKAIEAISTHRAEHIDTTIAMIDIDHFKRINDTYGHDAGDAVLYHFATLIDHEINDIGMVARYGGEEFVLLVSGDFSEAVIRLERVRLAISNMVVTHGSHQITLTASIGVRFNLNTTDNIDTLIAEADRALYYSKEHGRNRVSVYSQVYTSDGVSR